jgi:hypothetical protein
VDGVEKGSVMLMYRTKTAVALASVVSTVLAWSAPARAQFVEGPRMDEYTAFTVGRHRLKLGVLAFDFGITERLSVGTDPPAWAARSVVDVVIPNLHVKYTLIDDERFRLSAQAAFYYYDLTSADVASGSLVAVPLTLWGSLPLLDKLSLHLEGAWNIIRASGTGNADEADIKGAVATEALQTGAMLSYRVRPRLALNLRGRWQAWMRPLEIDGEKQFDPYTRADLHATVEPRRQHPLAMVVSGAYFWDHVHLSLGVGYGSYFIPGPNVYLDYQGIIPEASLSFLF